MNETGEERLLAKLMFSLANEYRIDILRGLKSGSNLTEIAKENNTTLSTLQRHVKILNENGLIEKSGRSYSITHLGEKVIDKLKEFQDVIPELKKVEKEKALEERKKEIEEIVLNSSLTLEELEKLIKQEKDHYKSTSPKNE